MVCRGRSGKDPFARDKCNVLIPFRYASGATVQILLFATIAIELKRRAPNAHVSVGVPCVDEFC